MCVRRLLLALLLALVLLPGAEASTTYTARALAGNPAVGIGCGGRIPCLGEYQGVSGVLFRLGAHDGARFVLSAQGAQGTPAQAGICFYDTPDTTGTELACFNANIGAPHFEDVGNRIPPGARGAYVYVSYGVDVTVTLEVS